MRESTQSLIDAFEQDHNAGCAIKESLYDIVEGYAAHGLHKPEMAEMIGISFNEFRCLLQRIDPEASIAWWQGNQRYEDSVVRSVMSRIKAGDSHASVSRDMGVPYRTVRQWATGGSRRAVTAI